MEQEFIPTMVKVTQKKQGFRNAIKKLKINKLCIKNTKV
jgi:hypothetical protein